MSQQVGTVNQTWLSAAWFTVFPVRNDALNKAITRYEKTRKSLKLHEHCYGILGIENINKMFFYGSVISCAHANGKQQVPMHHLKKLGNGLWLNSQFLQECHSNWTITMFHNQIDTVLIR